VEEKLAQLVTATRGGGGGEEGHCLTGGYKKGREKFNQRSIMRQNKKIVTEFHSSFLLSVHFRPLEEEMEEERERRIRKCLSTSKVVVELNSSFLLSLMLNSLSLWKRKWTIR
jgi:hypothetical protein